MPNFTAVLTKITALFLLFCLSFQCMVKLGIVVDYNLNKELITKTFCVNKAKPVMKCNGQCHLAKELKKAEEEQTKSEGQNKTAKAEWPIFISGTPIETSFQSTLESSTQNFAGFKTQATSDFHSGVFHPPSQLV